MYLCTCSCRFNMHMKVYNDIQKVYNVCAYTYIYAPFCVCVVLHGYFLSRRCQTYSFCTSFLHAVVVLYCMYSPALDFVTKAGEPQTFHSYMV